MKAPAFQWYPKDADTDEKVRAMDDREYGFYMRCLNHSWTNLGLPSDLKELARVMGRTPKYVEKVWARVGPCFIVQNGRFINRKQEEQRQERDEYISDARESGRQGAEKRWKRDREPHRVPHQDPTPTPLGSEPSDPMATLSKKNGSASASASASPQPETEKPMSWQTDEQYMRLKSIADEWGAPTIEEDWRNAWFWHWGKLDPSQQMDAIENLALRVQAGDDPRYFRPANYLNPQKGEWKRKVPPPRAASDKREATHQALQRHMESWNDQCENF